MEHTSAFTTRNKGIVNRLINNVSIINDANSIVANALWDTGATGTCISHDVVKSLGLVSTGRKNVQTPSGSKTVGTYLVDIKLPNSVNIMGVEVCDTEIGTQGIDLLIGMDIINLGDLSVSNYNGTTVFSFRVPSVKITDYVAQINTQNIIGKPHGKGKRKRNKK